MDKDHRLDAPDNDSLQAIQQIDDRSELTTIYPHAHTEWEGTDLISRDEREKQHSDERLRISLSLRKWFIPIGFFIPLPFVYVSLLVTLTANYISIDNLKFLMLPVLIIMGFTIFLTYRGFKYGYKIFYSHGVKGGPFVFSLLSLLAISLNGVFLVTEPLHTGVQGIDMLIVAGAVFLLSFLYSLILVFVWSSPRLTSGVKIAVVGILALLALVGTALLYVL